MAFGSIYCSSQRLCSQLVMSEIAPILTFYLQELLKILSRIYIKEFFSPILIETLDALSGDMEISLYKCSHHSHEILTLNKPCMGI
jgi:hypothetical protein